MTRKHWPHGYRTNMNYREVRLAECLRWMGPHDEYGHQLIVPFTSRLGPRTLQIGELQSPFQALDPIPRADWEEYAAELAEMVAMCGRGERGMRCLDGVEHTGSDVEAAFETAMKQLEEREHGMENLNMWHQQLLHRKWRGQVPAVSLFPTDRVGWVVMSPDKMGDPQFYDVDKDVEREVLPPPNEIPGLRRDASGLYFPERES